MADDPTPKEIENETLTALKELLGLNELPKLHDRILDDLKADSLDVVEIKMEVEEKFMIQITDAEAFACKTVADVVGLAQWKIYHREAA